MDESMKIKEFYKIKVVIICLFVLSLTGGIFFLPLPLNGKYTCFYHRVFDENQPVLNKNPDPGIMQLKTTQNQPGSAAHGSHQRGDLFVDRYISHYAIFWWGSIGLFVYCIYRLRSRRHEGKERLN